MARQNCNSEAQDIGIRLARHLDIIWKHTRFGAAQLETGVSLV